MTDDFEEMMTPEERREFNEEFAKIFFNRILDNPKVMKRLAKCASPYLKIPTGSDIVRDSLANEIAEILTHLLSFWYADFFK